MMTPNLGDVHDGDQCVRPGGRFGFGAGPYGRDDPVWSPHQRRHLSRRAQGLQVSHGGRRFAHFPRLSYVQARASIEVRPSRSNDDLVLPTKALPLKQR
jgi:hypothetical protein